LVEGQLINIENWNVPIYGINTVKIVDVADPGTNIPIHYEFTYDGVPRYPFIMYPKDPHPEAGGTGHLY
jgi:hypothetical protein